MSKFAIAGAFLATSAIGGTTFTALPTVGASTLGWQNVGTPSANATGNSCFYTAGCTTATNPIAVYFPQTASGGTVATLTINSLMVAGTTPYNGAFKAHLHNQVCANGQGGGHWKYNNAIATADETNELWFFGDYTSPAAYFTGSVAKPGFEAFGANAHTIDPASMTGGTVGVKGTPSVVAALSVVIHQSNAAKWFCCDLVWANNMATCNSNPWVNYNSTATAPDTISANVSITTGVPKMFQAIADLTTSGILGGTNLAFASTAACVNVTATSSSAPVWQINSTVSSGTVSNELWLIMHTNSTSGAAHWGTGRYCTNADFTSLPASVVVQTAAGVNTYCADIAPITAPVTPAIPTVGDTTTTTVAPVGGTTTPPGNSNGASMVPIQMSLILVVVSALLAYVM